MECKTGSAKLREQQERFRDGWRGVVIVANSGPTAVERFTEAYRNRS